MASIRAIVGDIPDMRRIARLSDRKKAMKQATTLTRRNVVTAMRTFVTRTTVVKARTFNKRSRQFQTRTHEARVQTLFWVGTVPLKASDVEFGGRLPSRSSRKRGRHQYNCWARIYKGQKIALPKAFLIQDGGTKRLRQRKRRARYPLVDPVREMNISISTIVKPRMRIIREKGLRDYLKNMQDQISRFTR